MTTSNGKTALLIVDVQLGMFTMQPPVYDGPNLLSILSGLMERARSAGVPVIFVQHSGSGAEHPLNPQSEGWKIHPAIAPRAGETVIHKRHCDSFHQTELQEELQRLGVTRLVIAGIQSDYCVDTTCRRAFSLNYDVTLVGDAHSTWEQAGLTAPQIIAHHNLIMGTNFAKVVAASDVQF